MTGSAQRAAALLLLLAAASCGGDDVDFYVHGAGVVVRTNAAFARRPDLPARIEGVIAMALGYWGGSWADLEGSRIELLDGPYVTCGRSVGAVGCYDGNLRISTTDPGAGTFQCVEQTVLAHEVGHAVLGDPRHADPRWMGFDGLAGALSGGRGYTEAGETDCTVAVSVWRHSPDGG